MKYIDAEKLIAEIRKLRSESCISESDDYYEYAKNEIIDIIESLQQEQSKVDLDELINDFLLNNSEFLVERDSKTVVQKLARHFYELGKNERK